MQKDMGELAASSQNHVYEIKVENGRHIKDAVISQELLDLSKKVSEKYPLKTTSEPIMPSQLPKRKINLPAIAKYAEENHICVADLSEAEKEALIQKFNN